MTKLVPAMGDAGLVTPPERCLAMQGGRFLSMTGTD
jgi:hypothetical protein